MRISRAAVALAVLLLGCAAEGGVVEAPSARPQAGRLYPVEVTTPTVLRGLPLGVRSGATTEAVTPCTTCHGELDATPLPVSADNLGGPHAGLSLRHGALRCAACHDGAQRDRLHLADGRSVSLLDAMELCAQCHGPQKRDYDHGAHGGMRGHWDLRSGPRTRNHCVACHDPHAPRFGTFAPVAAPRDRFSPEHDEGSAHE